MLVLPQRPQLVEIVPKRRADSGVNFACAESVTFRMFPCDCVRGQCTQFPHLLANANNSLRKQKTRGEFLIVSWRSHRHHQWMFPNPNFQRLFHSQLVGDAFHGTIRLAAKNAASANPTKFNVRQTHH